VKRTKLVNIAACLSLAVVLLSQGGFSQVLIGDFAQALSAIPLTSSERILNAIELGLSGEGGFPAEQMLHLIQQLATLSGDPTDKEAVLLLLTRALEEELPVDGLLAKGFELAAALEEGLPIEEIVLEARKLITLRMPLSTIEQDLSLRLALLRGVRDQLFDMDIFILPPGATPRSPSELPASHFNQLLVQIADAIGDYLAGGGSPHVDALLESVSTRLENLSADPNPTIPKEDVDLVLKLPDPLKLEDLTAIALEAQLAGRGGG
jgi:hypothetical protein